MEIVGRITRDAEVKTLKDNRQVVNFSVAMNHRFKAKGAKEATQKTTYVECAYWLGSGIADYLTKGTLVQLLGQVDARAYTNKNGDAVGVLTCFVNNIKLHGGPRKSNVQNSGMTPRPEKVSAAALTEPLDDLPF
jgi:single-strand DNA-binding protein